MRTLFSNDDWAFPRAVLAADVTEVSRPEHGFVVAVVHLKAGPDDESLARRRAACQRLDAWIRDEQSAGHEGEYVVIGDFNDELTDPPEWNSFGPLLEAPDGRFATLPLELAGQYTYLPFESFLDHAHVRGPALPLATTAEVLHFDRSEANYESTVSDHRPVMVTLRWE